MPGPFSIHTLDRKQNMTMTKILVIDDVIDNIRLLSFELQHQGYEALSASSGRQGLEIAASEHPDVILLDVMMPDMGGIEVCRRLKADPQTRMIPVILVTAMGLDENVIAGLDAGADDYVSKPYRKEVLAARIRAAMRIKESYDAVLRTNQQLQEEIASRKLAEEELLAKQQELVRERANLQTIFDGVQVGMLLVDENTQVTRVNNVFARLVGKEPPEFVGHQPGDGLCCIHASETLAGCGHSTTCSACPVRSTMEQVLKRGETVRDAEVAMRLRIGGEEQRLCLSINATPLELDGKKYALLALMDISQSKRAEERYRALFESSRDAIMILAPPSWKFTSGNSATVALFGTRDESKFSTLCPWDLSPEMQPDGRPSAEKAKEIIETAMSEGSHFFEWTHKKMDGEDFPATVLLTRMELDGKAMLQATVRDITEQKERETQVERLNHELVDASRRAGMAEVATGVLHNVGNVLNSVNVSANLIAEKLNGSRVARVSSVAALLDEHSDHLMDFFVADARGNQLPGYLKMLGKHLEDEKVAVIKELDELHQNVEHVKEIINLQQAHSRASGVLEVVRLDEVLDGAIKLNSASFLRHNVRLLREYEEVPPLMVDKHRLLQILVNLIGNARDALKASTDDDKRLILRMGVEGESCATITVSDNGVGISPENMPRIFEHGFTTKPQGHGFGLHSSALAAKELGGSLEVDSDGPGSGASFRLELPLTVEETTLCTA